MEGGQALLEGADKGVYPVVAQDHALREAEVELLHGGQRGDVGASAGDQELQQLQEFLLDSVCGDAPSDPGVSSPRSVPADLHRGQPDPPGLTRPGSRPPSRPGPPLPTWQVDVGGPVAPLVGEAAEAAAVPGAVVVNGLLRLRLARQAGGEGQAGAPGATGTGEEEDEDEEG